MSEPERQKTFLQRLTEFPILNTSRLLLRAIEERDYSSLLLMYQNPAVMEFMNTPEASSEEDLSKYLNLEKKLKEEIPDLPYPTSLRWVIVEKNRKIPIGEIDFIDMFYNHGNEIFENLVEECQIAIMINQDFWNKGYATEAMLAVLDFLFMKLEIPWLIAYVKKENARSLASIEKFGFVRFNRGEFDCIVEYNYGLSRKRYLERREQKTGCHPENDSDLVIKPSRS